MSWPEFFGPHEYNSDLFTTLQRENISNSTFDYSALDIDIYRVMYPASLPQQFDPEDIIIVTNSLCISVCADFVEMMHHEAAVRTVIAHGSPKPGPMQTASGSRGAQLYTADLIDNDISAAKYLNTSTNKLLPDRSVDTLITFLGINLRDQMRQDQPDIPVQFLYNAADCRIFYTTETWLNYTSLWTCAVNAIFSNSALCVPNPPAKGGTDPPSSPPSPSNNNAFNASALNAKLTTEFTGVELDSFTTVARGKARTVQQTCNNHGNDCSSGYCRLDLKTPGTKGTSQGRRYTFRDGTCPTNPAGNGGDLKDLVTDSDQPREIHGKRSTNKLAGRLE